MYSKDGRRIICCWGIHGTSRSPCNSFRSGPRRNIACGGAIIGAECFLGRIRCKSPNFRAASLSHASGQMQPEVMCRQAVLWIPRAKCNLFANRPLYEFCNSSLVQVGDGARDIPSARWMGNWSPGKYSGIHRSYSLTFAQVQRSDGDCVGGKRLAPYL